MVDLQSRRGATQHHDHRIILLIKGFGIFSISAIIIVYYYFFTASFHTGKGPDGVVLSSGNKHDGIPSNGISRNTVRGTPPQPIETIAYAITVSGCPLNNGSRGDFGAGIKDGAAVLKHSIHLNSFQNYPQSQSLYEYKMYALVHLEAESCARSALEPLGYEILLRDVPVQLAEIEGHYLREKVPSNGCCGEKEFVKLHAYTLIQHPIVVHLDLDTLVLKPMDRLYDVMINGAPKDGGNGGVDVAFGDPLIPTPATDVNQINAFFTRDYNMAHRGMEHAGVQGGFLVLRPSLDAYNEFVSIIRKGDFRSNGGWGGMGFGPFYGVSHFLRCQLFKKNRIIMPIWHTISRSSFQSMTFQGIIPYFYDHFHPGTGIELNRCIYNNMADNPRDKPTKNDVVSGSCRDGYNRPDKNDACEDCRSRPIEDVVTTHFTLCQKPWECLAQDGDRIQSRLCRKFHREWYRIREDLETTLWGREKVGLKNNEEVLKVRGGDYQIEHFRGYCKSNGERGYIQVVIPGQAD